MNYGRDYICYVANGEGLRVALFITECVYACPGRYHTSGWTRLAGKPFIPDFQDAVFNLCRSHDGLSLSGGYPLLPANQQAITDLSPRLKQRYPKKDIWLWTDSLYKNVQDLPLLCHEDVLIDGR